MSKRGIDNKLYLMFIFSIVFFLGALIANYFFWFDSGLLDLTGKVTGSGTITLTQAGTAGVTLDTNAVAFGSGYFNASGSCGVLSYSSLDSNNSALRNYNDLGAPPICWINTTSFLGGVNRSGFVLVNNGSVGVNVSAIADKDGEDWLCAGNCPLTNVAALSLLSNNTESSSCATGLTTGFESMVEASTNVTVGLCDNLDFADSSDSMVVYVNASIPKDTISGAKTLTIIFQALAV